MGGKDVKENLAYLTPEEHYVAHQLLVKIHPEEHSLVKAAFMMSTGRSRNNKIYGWVKRKFSAVQSEVQSGEKSSQRGRFWITDGKTNIKLAANSEIPDGWKHGRRIKNVRKADLERQAKEAKRLEEDKMFQSMWKEIIENNLSLCAAEKKFGITKQRMMRYFKKRFPEEYTERFSR